MGIIRSIFPFIAGAVSGIYIAQNYDVPNVKRLANTVIFMATRFEERYRKPNSDSSDDPRNHR